MSQSDLEINRQLLHNLMQKVNISDLEELSLIARVPRLQLIRIQRGLILNLSVRTITKIARALDISVDRLIETFVASPVPGVKPQQPATEDPKLTSLKQEYQRLRQEMSRQRETLTEEFQQASIHAIESWLLQWPTAVAAVHKNPQLPASRLLTLVKPIEQLLQDWNLETIATVGEQLAYDPQYHQLMKGTAEPGELVEVRYVGYKQEGKLLYKAKVSPLE